MIRRRDLLKALAALPILGRLRSLRSVPAGIVVDLDSPGYYRRAFARLSSLTEADQGLIAAWNTVPLDDAVGGLLERFATALDDWRRATSAGRCDWPEVVNAEGLVVGDHNIFHLKIGKIALIRARSLLQAGRPLEALDDVFAAASFGRHVGHSGLLISRVSQFAVENQAIAALGAMLPRLGPEAMATIPARVEGLPRSCSWAETLRVEGRFIVSNLSGNVATLSRPFGVEDLQGPPFHFPEDCAVAIVEATDGDRDRLAALVPGVLPYLDRLAEVADLPRASFGKALESFRSRAGGIHPVAASVVEWVDHGRFMSDRVELLWSMVLAARTRIVDGLDRFRTINDPFGDGPFAIVERPGGFELRSALHREGKPPAVVRVGAGPA